ncbi:MAG: hypothetical protein ACNA8P_05225 [Phycisphaerales bacterium]
MMRHTKLAIGTCLAVLLSTVGAGCGETTRVISVRGGLQNIEGAEGGIRPGGPSPRNDDIQTVAMRLYGPLPGEPVDGSQLRRKLDDGSILLVSRTTAELVFHLRRTIRDEEWDLLYEQLLSKQLKEAYIERDMDPTEAREFVKRHARAVVQLLSMVPAGDQTPGSTFRRNGRNAYRLIAPGGKTNEIPFTSMDVVYEDRQFKLRMLQ